MLPIHAVLEPLKAALSATNAVVLAAPPGAGKTTVVPLALLDQSWLGDQKVLVLEPRRLAARAAADRMATSLGQKAGGAVGYRTRLQSRIGPDTRIEVITEGVFTRMILDDPALEGVGAVLFDEFHERSLDADLGLALARESQSVLRDDLRLLVMSATLDIAGVSRLLDGAPVIEAEGRMFPVETLYLGRNIAERFEDAVARAVMQALGEQTGSMLVFLPGQGEIHRTVQRLNERLRDPSVDVVALYGALDKGEQDRAIEPAPPGRRKVVLATSVAETSLTIEGVRVVIDGGLSRVPRFEPSSGLTRLATVKVSRSSAEQRRGRAGRVEPGVCYRLWDEEQTRGLVPHQRPEIQEADLTAFALDLARWGAKSVEGLALLDPPPAGALAEARKVLTRLGALDARGDLTAHGRRLTRIPLPPRLAHMVAVASDQDDALTGAKITAVLSEPGLGGNAVDLHDRLKGLERDRSPRARDAMKLAERWARAAGGGSGGEADAGLLLAEAFPERIARARGKPGEVLLASGRGAFLDPTEHMAREPWLAVAELGGGDARDRIRLAAALDATTLEADLAHRIEVEDRLAREPSGKPVIRRIRRIGALVLDEKVVGAPDRATMTAALKSEVEAGGLKALNWGEQVSALRGRLAFLHGLDAMWPDVSDEGLLALREDWLWPLLDGARSLGDIGDGKLAEALRGLIPWDLQRKLDDLAPPRLTTPLGSASIDYAAEGGPRVDIRVQELFGVKTHPMVGGGRVPLTLSLLSPARRPVQVTKDLPGFWTGSWAAVRSEMRGRYPRHPWPEDPANATATSRAKPRGT
ncbi:MULTISPECIES: ATP-dependent helicase HrpB [unclassified Brevundimonas]|uniref:ATP-dependent helicase HrpB n=1 Tax=unclassified Brevundimonas TaxID=2622653 RepID=UPI000CFE30C0|nr:MULTISPECIES: ATP-dependent helicase HrpB [unclassified Brevundimonas]PRA33552.1 ATP-dependent helicase HrpB [Brevundimonas sp. MYb27]PQZ81768.1 ATP-dependent helicase HrpB [Brevundimonas sp. MYb31]PRB13381.1 ATP-dependent helicase HrpB [Brevundimonas sp. MYb52]PRB34030.1 ATP-dependent helicase HrpB [Brevundimonas sp. MYb46]PRB52718.1 ATP-dependent helicase HrpB [Brevundimonas sp. MYb33]